MTVVGARRIVAKRRQSRKIATEVTGVIGSKIKQWG